MSTAVKEAKRITIEGGLVRLERIVVEREAKTEEFMAEVARMQPLDSGLLPDGCVLFRRACDPEKRTMAVYVVERLPCMQSIRFLPTRGGEDVQEMTLSWPRTVWFCRTVQAPSAAFASISDCAVSVVKKPVRAEGPETKLYRLPMPNLYEEGNGAICTGNLNIQETEAPVALRIGDLVRQVLESAWNTDLMPEFEGLGIEGLEDWAKKSALDPEFHEKIAFRAHRAATVGGLLKEMAEQP